MTPSLWTFALDVYGRPGVSAACLTLQDEAGVDVIQLLAVLYADLHGSALGRGDIDALGGAMAAWREHAVLPLREARRFLKQPLPDHDAERESLRQSVKAAELAAEKLQIAIADSWLQAHGRSEALPLRDAIETLCQPGAIAAAGRDRIDPAIEAIVGVAQAFTGG